MLVLLISETTKSKKARESININQRGKKAAEEKEEKKGKRGKKKKAFYNLLFLCGFSFLCSKRRRKKNSLTYKSVLSIHLRRGDSQPTDLR
jgi:hypothetical protein